MKITRLKGGVRGESKQGPIWLSSLGEVDIHIEGGLGDIHLDLPSASAAKVDLGSVKGKIHAPKHLTSRQLKGLRVINGKLKGKEPGSVYVRTNSGQVFLK